MLDLDNHVVGTYEAKTHWSEITERVAAGETFTITKHGKPIGQIAPLPENLRTRLTHAEIRDQILKIRQGQTLAPLTLQQLKEEGRRY